MASADLEHLRTLLTIARSPSFAAAAEALHVTPSAVSQQIKVLEGRLGTLLFEKSGRSVRLTADAAQLVDRLKPLFAQIDDAIEDFTDGGQRVRGKVVIAGPDAFCRMWLTPRIPKLLAKHEELVLDVKYLQNDAVERALVSGEVDLAVLVATPEAPGLETSVLFREELVAVASPKYLDEQGEPHKQVDLDQHRFVIFDPHARILEAWLRGVFGAGAKLRGKVVCSVRSLEQNLALAEQGVGIAIVPNHVAQPAVDAGGVRVIEVERRTKRATNAIHLAWRSAAREAARVRAVREMLLEGAGD
jgi:LysR family glycine cleavage system transcriptional activator